MDRLNWCMVLSCWRFCYSFLDTKIQQHKVLCNMQCYEVKNMSAFSRVHIHTTDIHVFAVHIQSPNGSVSSYFSLNYSSKLWFHVNVVSSLFIIKVLLICVYSPTPSQKVHYAAITTSKGVTFCPNDMWQMACLCLRWKPPLSPWEYKHLLSM